MASSKAINRSTALFLSINLVFFALVSCHEQYDNVDPSSYQYDNVDPSSSNGGLLDGLLNGDNNGGLLGGLLNGNNNEAVNVNDLLNNRKLNPNDQYRFQGRCGTLNLGVCVNVLGLVKVDIGEVPTQPCCSLITGLVDLEAALCLCANIRANVLGLVNLNLPINLSLLLNNCGRSPAYNYMC